MGNRYGDNKSTILLSVTWKKPPEKLLMSRDLRKKLPTYNDKLLNPSPGQSLMSATNCCRTNNVRKHFMTVEVGQFLHRTRANQ